MRAVKEADLTLGGLRCVPYDGTRAVVRRPDHSAEVSTSTALTLALKLAFMKESRGGEDRRVTDPYARYYDR